MLSTQSSLIADFCIVYLWILTYCNYSVTTVPRDVLTWICQNPEAYKPKYHHRRWFTRATSQSPCLHGTLRSAAITIKTRKAWFYRLNAFWLVTVKVLNSYVISFFPLVFYFVSKKDAIKNNRMRKNVRKESVISHFLPLYR